MMKNKIALTVFLITSCFLTAQQQEINDNMMAIQKDSLRAIIQQHKGDTTEVNTIFRLCLLQSSPDSIIIYAREGIAMAQKIKYKKGEASCYSALGGGNMAKENQSEAIQNFSIALRIYSEINDFKSLVSTHFFLYVVYYSIGDIATSLTHLLDGLKIAEKNKVENFLEGAVGPATPVFLAEIGKVYLQQNHLDSSLIYVQKVINQNLVFNGSAWNFPIYILGSIERQKGNYERSLSIYREAIHLANQNQFFWDTLQIISGISTLFKMQNKLDSSIYYAQEVVQSKDPYRQQAVYFEAINNLGQAYKLTGKTDSALKYIEISHVISDSTNNLKKNREILNNAFNEKMKQREIISAQEKYKSKIQFYIVFGGLFIMLFIAALLWNNNRHREKAYELLQNQKEETEIQKKRVEEALDELKTAQAHLIQSEKMASLGELTTGIAHEIQNPLNFVNNFADVNTELIDEAERALDQDDKEESKKLMAAVRENEEKIKYHGGRADAIVKSMLQHSRTNAGQKEPTDINALADEYLRLAYHGLRAKDKSFIAALKTDFDSNIGKANIISQDIGRVLLNLYNNAFYAVSEKHKIQGSGFNPEVTVSTKKSGNKILISVKDNGDGIPKQVKDKIFQPFFTTKPTGQGTGLGLSLSYDIVKTHGGEIKVESKEGDEVGGTIFIIELPV